MKNHTNLKNSSEQITQEVTNFTTKQVLESIQPERANIIDLYKYAGQKYLVILFIGIIGNLKNIIWLNTQNKRAKRKTFAVSNPLKYIANLCTTLMHFK